MSDGYSEICDLADLLDDKNRERLLSVAGTAFDAVEEFFGAARVMTGSPGTFAKRALPLPRRLSAWATTYGSTNKRTRRAFANSWCSKDSRTSRSRKSRP